MATFNEVSRDYALSEQQLEAIVERHLAEFELGLTSGPPTATVAMLPSFVPALPDGSERGRFLALDLGGTNMRALLVDVRPGSPLVVHSRNFVVSQAAMTGSGEQLFDFVVDCLAEFVNERGLQDDALSLGFVFSYPCHQTGLRNAELLWWTKGFTCSNTIGRDVVCMLQDAIDRKGGLKVQVRAIMNDTVGHLAAAAYEHGADCTIGVVVSTGCNASYVERTERIKKLDAASYSFGQMVVDTEWEEFGNDGQLDAIRTPLDAAVDSASVHVGKQTQDKFVAALYLGDHARRLLLRAADAAVFGADVSARLAAALADKHSLPAEWVTKALRCPGDVPAMLTELGVAEPPSAVVEAALQACALVSDRSAAVLAAAIAALVRHMGCDKLKIGIGGSLYKHHPTYDALLRKWLQLLLNEHCANWDLVYVEDGSGKGAALVAAIAEKLGI